MAAAAPEIDRLVWAVRDLVRARRPELPASAALSAPSFQPLVNLVTFIDVLSESFIRRRYIYRPEPALIAFLAELETDGYLVRHEDRLLPTDRLTPIVDEVRGANTSASRMLWQAHEALVEPASAMARQVLDAAVARDVLVEAAQQAPEPDDPFARFWQRLSGLRLVRNEAHVEAWRAAGLSAGDVEVLTGAWAGSELQAPPVVGDRLVAQGYVDEGAVTDAGLAARQRIEDATNEAVAPAFSVIDQAAFVELLQALPPIA